MNKIREAIAASATGTVQRSDDEGVQNFLFTPDFPGFSGHFPGYPILPAVIQVLTAQTVAEAAHGAPLRLNRLQRAKYLKQLRPGQEVTVHCRKRASADHIVWDAKILSGDEIVSSFQMSFEQGETGR